MKSWLLKLILFLCLSLVSIDSFASWTIRGNNQAYSAGGATTITAAVASVAAGDFVILITGCNSITVTMTASDGTTSLTPGTRNALTDAEAQFFYLPASVATGTVTYTVTFSGSINARYIGVYVFTPTATPTLDQAIATGQDIGTAINSGNITTVGSDVIVFGGSWNDGELTITSPLIGGAAATGSQTLGTGAIWYKVVTGTVSASATISGSAWWTCNAMSFNIASAGGYKPATLTLLGAGAAR